MEVLRAAALRNKFSTISDTKIIKLLLIVASLGIAARVVVDLTTYGTNDVYTWLIFTRYINEHGLFATYEYYRNFNHPPLMGWMASGLFEVASTKATWPAVFRTPSIIADALVAFLLYVGAPQANKKAGAIAAALFAWSPAAILVSSYHGNTDALCAALSLLAALLFKRKTFFLAGLVLGAAINVKLIPLFIVPVFCLSLRTFRDLKLFCLGLGIAAIPFLFPLIFSFDAFFRNVFQYNSQVDNWGISYLLKQFQGSRNFARIGNVGMEAFVPFAKYLILLASVLVGLVSRLFGKWSPYEMAFLPLAFFLILTPGFGVQYSIYVVPLFFAINPRWAVLYVVPASMMVYGAYGHFWTRTWPAFSSFRIPLPGVAHVFGFVAWLVLIAFVIKLWRQKTPSAAAISSRQK